MASASNGISSRRRRSGGIWTGITFRRKKRSSRNVPCRTSASRSRLVAAITRRSTACSRSSPTRRTCFSCSTRSSLTCTRGGNSPTSSRNSVPPSADSINPTRSLSAPVNAPLRWPKSSDSNSPSGMAPQCTGINASLARDEQACTNRAASSLPVPDSPEISTVKSDWAPRCRRWRTRCIGSESPSSVCSRCLASHGPGFVDASPASPALAASKSARSTADASASFETGLVR